METHRRQLDAARRQLPPMEPPGRGCTALKRAPPCAGAIRLPDPCWGSTFARLELMRLPAGYLVHSSGRDVCAHGDDLFNRHSVERSQPFHELAPDSHRSEWISRRIVAVIAILVARPDHVQELVLGQTPATARRRAQTLVAEAALELSNSILGSPQLLERVATILGESTVFVSKTTNLGLRLSDLGFCDIRRLPRERQSEPAVVVPEDGGAIHVAGLDYLARMRHVLVGQLGDVD